MNHSSKSGVKVTLLASVLFFCGTMDITMMLLVALVILYVEDNAWLKSRAKQALIILLIYMFASIGIKLLEQVIQFVYPAFYMSANVTSGIALLKNIVFVVLGIGALFGNEISFSVGLSNGDEGQEDRTNSWNESVSVYAENIASDSSVCSKCGNELGVQDVFCMNCGTRVE